MLKFLTHKLRTHSLNEDNFMDKADDDHDSGTESDEEIDHSVPSGMSERMCSVSPADTGCSMESPGPDHQHDPHSSEEELEVINSQHNDDEEEEEIETTTTTTTVVTTKETRPLRATSVCLPEKRKWSQISNSNNNIETTTTTINNNDSFIKYSPENEENMSHYGNLSPTLSCSPCKRYGEEQRCHNHHHHHHRHHIEQHSGSSDEEVHHLLASMATPVQFRTSPPLEAVKPGRKTASSSINNNNIIISSSNNKSRSMSPPSKLLHYEVSPKKRTKHMKHHHHHHTQQQRPYLDFEKMQQQKARSVTWRHSGDHTGELSVFCW